MHVSDAWTRVQCVHALTCCQQRQRLLREACGCVCLGATRPEAALAFVSWECSTCVAVARVTALGSWNSGSAECRHSLVVKAGRKLGECGQPGCCLPARMGSWGPGAGG